MRIWGRPAFIHRRNDPRMRRELHPADTIVFANGAESRPSDRNSNDIDEQPAAPNAAPIGGGGLCQFWGFRP